MARLKTMRPTLSSSSGRAITRKDAERRRFATRDDDRAWRAWYGTARWRTLREQVLTRALWTCEKTGVHLLGKHPAPNSPVVDHIRPHRGDPDLFWDPDNLQAVTKAWHDSIKQARERAGAAAAAHPAWLQPSSIPLTIVCGPPCSGKSSWAEAAAGPRDLIIDLDRIAQDISGEPLHGWSAAEWLGPALWRRNDIIGSLSREPDYRAAYLIVSEPQARWRDWWQDKLKPDRIVVLEVEEPECMRRAAADGRDLEATEAAVTSWWAAYGRRIGEERIRPHGAGGGGKSLARQSLPTRAHDA